MLPNVEGYVLKGFEKGGACCCWFSVFLVDEGCISCIKNVIEG